MPCLHVPNCAIKNAQVNKLQLYPEVIIQLLVQKQIWMGKRKNQIQKLSKSKKIRKYGKADLYGEKKVQNPKLSESMKIRKYGIIGKSQPSGINKSKSTFGPPSKRKQNSKSNEANNRSPEICKSLISFDFDEYPDILAFSAQIVIKKAKS